MNKSQQRLKLLNEFSDNYAELYVSVFIIKYSNLDIDTIYKDLLKCLQITNNKIRKKAYEELIQNTKKIVE